MDFDRQKIIGNYIVDFFCAEKRVVIEIDGSSHDDKADYDAQRDAFLIGLDLVVIHIGDSDVKNNLSGVVDFLRNHSALATTPPLRGTPPEEGNVHPKGGAQNSPPLEGCQAQPDGVV